MGAACDYLSAIGMDKIHAYEKEIGGYLYEKVGSTWEGSAWSGGPVWWYLCSEEGAGPVAVWDGEGLLGSLRRISTRRRGVHV